MWQKIERLLALLENLPQTIDGLNGQADQIVTYAKWIFYIVSLIGVIYTLRTPFKFVLDTMRWREMRDIDREETESEQATAAVRIAQAKKGADTPVTTEDILAAAEDDYPKVIKALRRGRKKHKL